ncbi:FAA hydrolase family protein, partial [Bacillus cereus]|nr:FAA hydrolase family protein [Bacillus cereus]
LECIERGNECIEKVCEIVNWAKENGEAEYYPLTEVKILAPIQRPRKNILCVGKNYREHAVEMGGVESKQENIMIFTKAPT